MVAGAVANSRNKVKNLAQPRPLRIMAPVTMTAAVKKTASR